jgi:hypothetical protein
MQRSNVRIASVFILVLGGCSSFNNSFNTYEFTLPHNAKSTTIQEPTVTVDEVLPTIVPAPQQVIIETKGPACGVSPYPEPDHPPELPTKALVAANGDVYMIERIERKHIDELRAYISERRRLNREARERFNAKCVTVSK